MLPLDSLYRKRILDTEQAIALPKPLLLDVPGIMSDQLTVVTSETLVFTQEELLTRTDLVELADFQPSRTGLAVPVAALLGEVESNDGDELVLNSSTDGFCATLPLAAAAEVGLIWFAGADGPLTKEQGGPFRFFIPKAAECKTAVLDNCANVKFVDRIEVRRVG